MSTDRDKTLIRLALSACEFLNPSEKLAVDEITESVGFFRSLSIGALCQITGRHLRSVSFSPDETLRRAERNLAFCERRGIQLVSYWSGDYPAALREIYDPPFLLFVRGRLPAPDRPSVSVIGTRQPNPRALSAATRLAEELVCAGIPVVSGLARGIDTAAHRGALAGGGPTIAVLGCGIDQVCPAGHRSVAAQIVAEGGALYSEYPPGTPPAKYRFPARNRIISGVSRGVVIIQAPERSGALITADYALEHGRDLFVHRAGLEGDRGAGTRALASDGAIVISTAGRIFAEWGLAGGESSPQSAFEPALRFGAGSAPRGDAVGAELGAQLAAELGLVVEAAGE